MGFPMLSVLALLPAVGAIALIFLRGALAKQVALAVSVLALFLAVILASYSSTSVAACSSASRSGGSPRSAPTTPSAWMVSV